MDVTEIAIKLAEQSKEIGSLKHRMDKIERIAEEIHIMSNALVRLTSTVENTNKNIEDLKTDVSNIKKEPEERLNQIKASIITALASSLITACVGAILMTIK